jgi:hypothetical protein
MTEGSDTELTSTGSTSDATPTTSTAATVSGDDSGTSSTTDLTTGDETTGGTTGPACLQIDHGGDPGQWPEQPEFTCGLSPTCPGEGTVVFKPTFPGSTTNDIDRARCMAAALRDRTPGLLEFEESGTVHTLEVLGEQVIRREEYEGIGFGYSWFEWVEPLQPPEFFADCAEGTASEVRDCLIFATTDECVETFECPG